MPVMHDPGVLDGMLKNAEALLSKGNPQESDLRVHLLTLTWYDSSDGKVVDRLPNVGPSADGYRLLVNPDQKADLASTIARLYAALGNDAESKKYHRKAEDYMFGSLAENGVI